MSRLEGEKLRRPTLRLFLTQKLGLETGPGTVALAESMEGQAREKGISVDTPAEIKSAARYLDETLKSYAVEDFSLGPLEPTTAPSYEVLGQLVKEFYENMGYVAMSGTDIPGQHSFRVPSGGAVVITVSRAPISSKEMLIWVSVDFVPEN